MSPAHLLTKLFRNNNIGVYSATNPATFLHQSCLFLRNISSNTSSAAAELSSQSESSVSSKRLENHPTPSITRKELNRGYTVTYLVESCGLPPKEAASASEKVHFATPNRPDSVLDLLRSRGFSKTQITQIVRKCPSLLQYDAEKNIFPKFEFFQSLGLSRTELIPIICYNPELLTRSLKNHIEPLCKLIKSFVQSDERVCTTIKNSSRIIRAGHGTILVPNLELLKKIGVPGPNISLLLTHFPGVLVQNHEEFSAGVSKAKEMGFNPSKSTFVLAVQCISGKSKKLIWDRSYKIYSKWGWSEEDILKAFKIHPHCMNLSEKKIELAMEFLVNTMGWSPQFIANLPRVLILSLEKRIKPRCSVIRVLWRKGLLSKDLSPSTILLPGEKDFLRRYVTRFEERLPQLLSVYKGEMDALDLP